MSLVVQSFAKYGDSERPFSWANFRFTDFRIGEVGFDIPAFLQLCPCGDPYGFDILAKSYFAQVLAEMEARLVARRLPEVLTRDEARALLATPNRYYPTGQRD